MKKSINLNSLEVHQQLVKLIMEESEIIKNTKGKERSRHTLILSFLIELQIISARSLL